MERIAKTAPGEKMSGMRNYHRKSKTQPPHRAEHRPKHFRLLLPPDNRRSDNTLGDRKPGVIQ
jgi:hypothetical protein